MNTRSVYRALNKPMTLLGVERRLFFCILMIAFAIFHVCESFLSALVFFAISLIAVRAVTQADPQLFQVLAKSRNYAVRYDPTGESRRAR